jgi:hypothetical protein
MRVEGQCRVRRNAMQVSTGCVRQRRRWQPLHRTSRATMALVGSHVDWPSSSHVAGSRSWRAVGAVVARGSVASIVRLEGPARLGAVLRSAWAASFGHREATQTCLVSSSGQGLGKRLSSQEDKSNDETGKISRGRAPDGNTASEELQDGTMRQSARTMDGERFK